MSQVSYPLRVYRELEASASSIKGALPQNIFIFKSGRTGHKVSLQLKGLKQLF